MSEAADKGKWETESLPETWEWVQFSEIWSDNTDSRRKIAKKDYMPDGDIPIIDQGEEFIGGYSNDENYKSLAPLPSIVWGDHTKCIKYVDHAFIQGADGVKVLTPTNLVGPRFSFFALKAIELPDKGYSRHFKFLRASTFPLPPLEEQRRIVTKLDSLFARTRRAREELARIPLLIDHYKTAILTAAFPADWDSRRTITLSEITKFVTSGSRGWAKFYAETGSKFIRIGNVRRESIKLDLSDVQHVQPPEGAEGNRTLLNPGDIVVTITADLGRIGLVPDDIGDAYVNQHVALVRLNDPSLSTFITWFLSSPHGQSQLFERSRGMTRAGLGLGDIRDVRVPDLTTDEGQQIVNRITIGLTWVEHVETEYRAAQHLLARLDQAYLTKAFKGELVLQDPNDEPTSVLLERIRAERQERSKSQKRADKGRSKIKKATTKIEGRTMAKKRTDVSDGHLSETLRELGGSANAKELWLRSEMDIDEFYKQLRDEMNAGRIKEGSEKEKLELAHAA